jgi:hypothetical protein
MKIYTHNPAHTHSTPHNHFSFFYLSLCSLHFLHSYLYIASLYLSILVPAPKRPAVTDNTPMPPNARFPSSIPNFPGLGKKPRHEIPPTSPHFIAPDSTRRDALRLLSQHYIVIILSGCRDIVLLPILYVPYSRQISSTSVYIR